uniref:SRCR domain-containing protein n=1 Tax=Cyprinus carpio TaxID=7962 RepID=A0A8C1JT76_CYPCA
MTFLCCLSSLRYILYTSFCILSAGNVRLVGGNNSCAGRVEVYYNEEWGTVCDDYWALTNTAVVCRELGCDETSNTMRAAHFGPGSGKIWMDNVRCSGSESSIFDCSKTKMGDHNCGHSEDVGVICSGIRLVGGSRCSGRLEVPHGNTWYTVCDAAFDQQDAEVVCRELDCGAPVQVLGAAAFGKGDAQMWKQEIQCGGDEYQFALCPTSPSQFCSHENDVSVVCAETVRLVGGNSRCAGRVEVLYRGQWGTVQDVGWDLPDAEVVCRELGCGEALTAPKSAYFGEGSGEVWISGLQCTGSELTLTNCRFNGWGIKANHTEDAGVICSGVRLVGGSRCSGRVEVPHDWMWVSVCDAAFDQQDAEVVCRELDCGAPVQVLGAAAFGKGDAQMWTQEIQCRGNESYISLCPTSSSLKQNCTHENAIGLLCSGRGSIRLVGSGGDCAGRLEVFHSGSWGTVCDDSWDIKDAHVVCRQLQCGVALSNQQVPAWFGPGSGPIWLDEVECEGNETSLWSCSSPGWGKHDCQHKDDVGVVCSDSVNVRLVSGHSRCAGRVEVFHRGQWGTVCDDFWDITEAAVVCRELDCGEPVDAPSGAHFGSGSETIWINYVECSGSESTLKNCASGGWGKYGCDHSKDAGVICSGVRLVGGSRCSGRLEILHNQTWMSVCDAVFDQQDAEVVCRELDCGVPVQVLGAAAFDKGDAQMWTQEIQCRGDESQIHLCPTSPSHENNCSPDNIVGLVCADHVNVRLVNGSSRCSGRVEVNHRGQWGTVCDDGWDLADAAVVCRELDCGEPVDALSDAHFGSGSGPIWMSYVMCSGSESTLKNCGSSGWGKHDCDHTKDVGVICSGNESQIHLCPTSPSHENNYSVNVRLVGGHSRCAGRVEVLHRGQWGTVCGDGWDLADAAVVCRELDCGEPVDALSDAHFGQGSGPIWINYIECSGSESTLKMCRSRGWGKHDCDHSKDAGVICSGKLLQTCSRCSGRLEILHNQTWMSVCDAAFDQQDAEVVCRELDCGAPVQVLGAAAFGKGDTQMWTQEIQCRGNESQIHLLKFLYFVSHFFVISTFLSFCPSIFLCFILFLQYTDHVNVRLVGGHSRCAGRVEVLHRGQWGTVCDDGWDMTDAAVVCRELDCGEPVDALGDAHFGSGSGPIWMSYVFCTGSESTLKNCGSSGWGKRGCDHTKDVGVICSASSLNSHTTLLDAISTIKPWFMGTHGTQCVTLPLTSRMQRLCVESWTVGLLYRCWEQLLLAKETLKCGHKRFSAEETNLIYIFVHIHLQAKTTVPMTMMLELYVLVEYIYFPCICVCMCAYGR